MITLILAGLVGSFGYLTYYYRGKYLSADFALEVTIMGLELQKQLVGDGPKTLDPQQTRIFGNAKTEDLIASWLEKGWSPLGDDLTDTENSRQIAARIRRGEYLDELVSSESQQSVCGDAG